MSLIVSRILHAGYILENNGACIAFDPIFENPFSHNCFAFPNIEFKQSEIRNLRLNAIFISHFHDDHCSLESLDLLDRNTSVYIFCLLNEIPNLIKELGFKNVFRLSINQVIEIESFKITVHQALDAEVDCLLQIQADKKNILNVIDSWIDWETVELLRQSGPWDLILWPFQTMRELEVLSPHRSRLTAPELPEEWLEQLQILNPKHVVPSSCQFVQEPWSWYNRAFFPITYQFFETEIGRILPNCRVVRLNPGKSIEIHQDRIVDAMDLPWIRPIGAQDVDYVYDPELKIPTTAEIARHFPKLRNEQRQRVENFLTIQIMRQFSLLEAEESSYFSTPRRWKLSTYSSDGVEKIYFYQIENSKMKLLSSGTMALEAVGWSTQIVENKIFSALTDGESLTSLYIRINDEIFTDEIEKQIVSTDATMDPLVRCLFSLNAASYQHAQLQRMKQKIQT